MSDKIQYPVPNEVPLAEEVITPASEDSEATKAPALDIRIQNITLRHSMDTPYTFTPTTIAIPLLNTSSAALNSAESPIQQVDPAKLKPSLKWINYFTKGVEHHYADNAFDTALENPDSDWRQGVEFDGRYITMGAREVMPKKDGGLITGEAALSRIRSITGMGGTADVPLWHSGVWVQLKACSDTELMELDRQLADAKTELGRVTVGSIFGNESVYLNSIVTTFILSRVIDSNVAGFNTEVLKRIIRTTDIPHLVAAFAGVIFKNGFPLARPCINNPRSCNHVRETLLGVTKMILTDNKRISRAAKDFMSKGFTPRTLDILEIYQRELLEHLGVSNIIPVHSEINAIIQVPSIKQYEEAGYKWIQSIVEMAEGGLATPLEGNDRENYIMKKARLTRLREYSHWIKEFNIPSTNELIQAQDDIEETLDTLSTSTTTDTNEEELADRVLKAVSAYIQAVTVTVIAIAKYPCPVCGTMQSDALDNRPNVIVVDALQLFFTLKSLRINSNLNR